MMEDAARYQTFWRRIGAMFLDGAALAPLYWADQVIWNVTTQPGVLLAWVIAFNLAWITWVLGFVVKFGQTPGKMACGVKIIDIDGGPVTLKQAALREIVPLLTTAYYLFVQAQNLLSGLVANRAMGTIEDWMWEGAILFGWMLLEAVTMLTNAKRRAIHDFIAGTVVIRVPARVGLMRALLVLVAVNFAVSWFTEDRNMNKKEMRVGHACHAVGGARSCTEAIDGNMA